MIDCELFPSPNHLASYTHMCDLRTIEECLENEFQLIVSNSVNEKEQLTIIVLYMENCLSSFFESFKHYL